MRKIVALPTSPTLHDALKNSTTILKTAPTNPPTSASARPFPVGYRPLLWYIVIAALNATAVVFYFVIITAYWFSPDTRERLAITQVVATTTYKTPQTVICVTFALAHATLLLQQIAASLWYRRLALRFKSTSPKPKSRWCCNKTGRRILDSYNSFMSAVPKVDHILVDVAWLCREMFQVGFQTAQAYRISTVVTSHWLRHAIVLGLCANCWSTPLISRMVERRRKNRTGATPQSSYSIERHREYMAAVLLVDAILEGTTFWVIPLAIVFPHMYGISYDVGTVDLTLAWKVRELELVFPRTQLDLVLNTSFASLMLVAVYALELPSVALVARTLPQADANARATSTLGSITQRFISGASMRVSKYHSKIKPVAHLAFAVWGIFVLAVHCHASSRQEVKGCARQLRPWFLPKSSCVVLHFNCHRDGHVGHASAVDRFFHSLNENALESIAIQHCPALETPQNFRALRSLQNLKIYNTTILAWGADAAISDKTHVVLGYIELVRITFQGGELPLGLVSDFLPPTVDTIAISACNLREIPNLAAEHWRTLSTLYLEMCELTSLPDAVIALDLSTISIAANQVGAIPFELFGADKRLEKLVISGNPILELPELGNETDVPAGFWHMDAAHTNISVIPSWVKHGLSDGWAWYVSFAATPACASLESILATVIPDDLPSDQAWILSVDCFEAPIEFLLQLELAYVDQVSRLT